ncbi:MAG: DUF4337 domain-containing protein [Verrucomicrobia bacterium]|nr:DUF4337 domain-containing protein [Verrucomicrobiota bacterium]
MKVEIPNQLKDDLPQTFFGKILAATPVVMAVVATMLAGLASSEMTRAQYARALAAQHQSKAGDQWSFFQAKRLRSSLQRNTIDLLQATTECQPLDAATFKGVAGSEQEAVDYLVKGEVPAAPAGPLLDSKIKAAIEAVEMLQPETEVTSLLANVTDKMLADALLAARDRVQAFEVATHPINQAVNALDKKFGRKNTSFVAARLAYTAQRYEIEARLNQAIANLYELQVRKSNILAGRHHARSQRFFFGMLAAQAGVIIATFAMAARKRNLLWALAAIAGLLAVAFAVYVYLYV